VDIGRSICTHVGNKGVWGDRIRRTGGSVNVQAMVKRQPETPEGHIGQWEGGSGETGEKSEPSGGNKGVTPIKRGA